MRFVIASLVLLGFIAGFNAVPFETVTRGRHGDHSEPATHAPHHTDPVTQAPTHAPHHTDPVTQAPTHAPHHTDPVTQAPTHAPHHTDPVTQAPTHAPHHTDPVTQAPTHAPHHGTTEEPWTATVTEGGKEYHVTCHQEGPMTHPGNVHKYIICEYQADHKHWHITVMPCAIGTRWHQAIKNCIADN